MKTKKLYELTTELQKQIAEMVTIQDTIDIVTNYEYAGASDLKDFLYETLCDTDMGDLDAIAETLQEFRRDTTAYAGYTDFETEKYFNLDLLFLIQEVSESRHEELKGAK